MTDLFVFGAQGHAPLLSEVLGRDVRPEPARLAGHAIHLLDDKAPPRTVLCEAAGAAAEGGLLRGLDAEDLARLAFHAGEAPGALRERQVLLGNGGTQAALVAPACRGPGGCGALFEPEHWRAEWAPLACEAAREIMLYYGRMEAADLAQLRPFIAARSWARLLAARGTPHGLRSGRGQETAEFLREKPGHLGFFRLRAFDLRFTRFDGTASEPISREGFVAYDASLVLPYDPETDRVLLIEQLRFGPLLRGDPHPSVLEPAAGLVDAGESPESCALREAGEEAGLTLRELRPMVNVYASPGYTTEFFHCFLGLCSLSARDSGQGGLEEEQEDIRNHVLSFDAAMALVDSGEINAGPLVMMLYWLAHHRDRLRAAA